jgi:hypothetical protein
MSQVEVIIKQSRQGPRVGYKSGERVFLDAAKAAFAVDNGWAEYADPSEAPALAAPRKSVPPITGKTAPVQGWEAVMKACDGDLERLKEMAKQRKVKGWALMKDPEMLAKRIAGTLA